MRILIVKTSSLGDIIHAFPVLEYIKHYHPLSTIEWVVEAPFAELVKSHPLIDRAVCVDSRRWRKFFFQPAIWREIRSTVDALRKEPYDFILDLQGNVKSGLITSIAQSRKKVGFNWKTVPEWPNVLATHFRYDPPKGGNIRNDYLHLASRALNKPLHSCAIKGATLKPSDSAELAFLSNQLQKKSGLKAVICPGSRWPNKQLASETLASFLLSFPIEMDPCFFLISGSESEKMEMEKLAAKLHGRGVVVHRLSLPALQSLMIQAGLVISVDSLPLHLAGMASVPSFSLFGPSSSIKYQPIGAMHGCYQGACPYGRKFDKRCDLLRTCKTGACLKQLKGKELFEQFYLWWKRHY